MPAPTEGSRPDFNLDAFVRDSIAKLRMRLLDLTSRNPLISFKHSGRSRRHVRVIDEIPDQLYSRFDAETVMRFKSLGQEPSEPDDEKSVLFRRALDAAKLEEPEYLQKLSEAGADPGEKVLARLERELRDRLRDRLGMPPRKQVQTVTPADVARSRSLDPSFDLPLSPAAENADALPAKHRDTAIQTLMYDEDLDRTLARIRDQVRLSMDEVGVNPLFCVFGFLEWYEDQSSETPIHSPLLLYPLQLERELVRGRYQYAVRTTGEPALANVALIERLKRDFNIELPAFDEEEHTPDKYFALIQKVIERSKGWKVRRWVTIGLFSFARIAMYKDLDPQRWEAEGGLHQNPCLSQMIGGGASTGPIAPELSDGAEPESSDVTDFDVPLIADADSSQVAAIQSALGGRNLVIEGPPRTGKSQTITNIIAAALAGGKRILFLAEKTAALNVVKDRLKEAQLDHFCMELHSVKGSRKEFFASLASRLQFEGLATNESELTGTINRLEQVRKRLDETVEALARPAGQLGITTQELLWRCHRLRTQTSTFPSEIDELSVPDAEQLTTVDVGRIVLAAEQFEWARGVVNRQYGSVRQHPWNGIARHDINPILAENLVRRVADLAAAAAQAEQAASTTSELTGWHGATLAELNGLSEIQSIQDPATDADDALIAQMVDPKALSAFEEFARDVAEHHLLETTVTSAFADAAAVESCSPEQLQSLQEAVTGAAFQNATVAQVAQLTHERHRESNEFGQLSGLVQTLASRANLVRPLSPSAERAVVAAAELAQADERTLAARTPPLLAPGASDVLRRASETCRGLREQRERLAADFALESADGTATLRQHASALRGAPIIPFISFGYWRARGEYRKLARTGVARKRVEMATALDELASFKDRATQFTADQEVRTCAGAAFRGLDSDLGQSLRTAEWADAVRTGLSAGDETCVQLRRFLFEVPPEAVQSLAATAAHSDLSALKDKALQGDAPHSESISQQADAAQVRAQCADRANAAITELRLRADWRLDACAELASQVKRMHELRESLDSSRLVQSLLGPRFAGHRTPVDAIRSSASHVRNVVGSALPSDLKQWLLASEATSRIGRLRSAAADVLSSTAAVEAAFAKLQETASVNRREWLGSESLDLIAVADLHSHAERCAHDPDGLQVLIDDARSLHDAREVGLGPLLDLLESRRIPLEGLGTAARRVVCQSIARAAIALSPVLANFTGDRFENLRKEFRQLDQRLKTLRQAKIANELVRRPVEPGSDVGPKKRWTGRALILHEVSKQQRHISTRELLNRAGAAVQQLMPCFMMSPLSVAQFLKPGAVTFDMVVMDEASQLRPQDALGAIARGAQVVIVGDPKQLPPTNFFMGTDDAGTDDEDETAVDEQSILEQAMAVFKPLRRLKWHYRSKHPSLIAFSNHEFYSDDPLILFPSPYFDRPEFGVKYVFVSDGRYKGRVNIPEARLVATAAMEHAANHPERSLGIVALNQPQAELIASEIDRMAAENEVFEAWRHRLEPTLERFFVKNLENVQGDERDVIFISTVFGKDDEGNFFQRFGPINNAGGHRRLNVLFTRSKFQTRVFSSMDPGDIRADENSNWGVRALKGYLRFAKDGLLEDGTVTGRSADSDFEVSVAEMLRNAGFEAVPQVGVAGYFIDIAVRHPKRPGDFVLGIECDGAAYHSTKSARDRDRLRQEVLERLKWRIHRIWSLEWYRNSRKETERLIKAVQEAIASDE